MKTEMMQTLKRSIKGVVRCQEDLAGHTSFRIGGPADIWVEPKDFTQ